MSKVPEVTFAFWIIKIAVTTLASSARMRTQRVASPLDQPLVASLSVAASAGGKSPLIHASHRGRELPS